MRPGAITIAAADLIAGLPAGVRAFMLSLSDDGLDCFDEGEGDQRNAQAAERLNLVHIIAWRGGWQVRTTAIGAELRELLAKEKGGGLSPAAPADSDAPGPETRGGAVTPADRNLGSRRPSATATGGN
jgi:hypothetical protein